MGTQGESRTVKEMGELPKETTPSGIDRNAIKQEFSGITPAPLHIAGAAYLNVSNALVTACNNLVDHATQLAKVWKGDAANQHLAQFQKLHSTMAGLADQSYTVGNNYDWMGHIMQWYHDNGSNLQDAGFFSMSSGDDQARQFRDRWLDRVGQGYKAQPAQIQKNLPRLGTKSGYGGPGGQPGIGGGGGGAPSIPSGGGGSGKLPKDPFGGKGPNSGPGPHLPTDPYGNNGPNGPHGGPGSNLPSDPFGSHGGSNLASVPGMGGGPGGGLGGGPGSGLGGPGGGLGADPGGLGGLGAGPGGLAGGMPGAAALSEEAAAAAAMGRGAGAGGMGGMGMPMGGGGHGGQSEERERGTWLTEDEDIWGVSDDQAPPVIG